MSAKLKYFTKAEWTLWGVSVLMIVGTARRQISFSTGVSVIFL